MTLHNMAGHNHTQGKTKLDIWENDFTESKKCWECILSTLSCSLQGASSGDDRRGHIASSSLVRGGQVPGSYWLSQSLSRYFIHPGH